MPTGTAVFKDTVAGAVVSLVALSFYISAATLLFQGPLAAYLPGAIGSAFLGGALLSAAAAWRGSQPLAAAGPEPATVPVLAAITAGIAAGTSAQAALPTAVAALALTALAIGGAWWLIGRLGAGNLVRYIPYPVIGGFLASIGWLMVSGGLGVAAGQPLRWATLAGLADPVTLQKLLAGLGIGLLLWWGGTRIRHVMFLPAMILLLSLAVHGWLQLRGLDLTTARGQGWLTAPFDRALPHWTLGAGFLAAVDWAVLARESGLMLSAVIVSAIGLLLSVGSLEVAFDAPADVNRDLRVLGLGNLACGLIGGLVGGISISRSITNQAAGATGRASGWVQAVLAVLALWWGGPVLALVPKALLGGLLASIGIGMLKAWLLDSRSRVSRWDYLTVAGMVLATAVFGFLPAVCIGVLACCVDFAVSSAGLPPVRRLLPRSAWPAKVERSPAQTSLLQAAGDGLRIVELQGVLFFGSVTRLVEELDALLAGSDRPRHLVLDFQRVPWVDSSAGQALLKLMKLARRAGAGLDFCGMNARTRQVLAAAGCLPAGGAPGHADIDAALRAWDDAVLQRTSAPDPLLEDWLAAELGSAEAADQVLAHFETLRLASGERLFAQGDAPDALYLVREGRLTASVDQGEQRIEVRTLHAGSAVGEMGLFRDSARSATLTAAQPSVVMRLGRDALQALQSQSPQLALALHRMLIRQLAGRLDQAGAQARALSS